MGKLIYTAITSLDGYIEDQSGGFDWAMPDPEVHAFVNDLERPVETHLYGRRMYETMAVWQTVGLEPVTPGAPAPQPEELDFAEVWRAADKVVFSRTLDDVATPRTRLHREFSPEAVRRLKEAADGDLSVSGPGLAQHAFTAGLVDEIRLFAFPVIVGGGKPGLPRDVRVNLRLLDERRFDNGVVHLRYTAR
ncbi:MAG TPA: dihydrofolate reductase family protein [Acidimicrobiales bacterium]|nr:dihydrofolate reductase family protein [Acidimicrobiales bacterium]